ncbi:MAG TPA: DUF2851 family protein [Puia sp.]|nr:DUF2851 family protein [Puia sp.]
MRDNRISEVLLHFIWQWRYYNQRDLTTEAGDPIFIHHPGNPNTDQGPDFKNARITIGDNILEGPVELHVKATDFYGHGHAGDPHYRNIILHVVWINDSAQPPAGIPVLVLGDRTPLTFINRYQQLNDGRSFVPCASLLSAANAACGAGIAPSPDTAFSPSPWPPLRSRLLCERLAKRTSFIRTLLDEGSPNWSEVLFLLIARSLGQPLNADAFLAVAKAFPLNFLLRRRTDITRLESLFISHAAGLNPPLSVHRMRPAHSPIVRLRQLAALLLNHSGRFTLLLESDDPEASLETLTVNGLGLTTRRSIVINAHIPLLYAYGTLRAEPHLREKALRWLGASGPHAVETSAVTCAAGSVAPPENNHVIRSWRELGIIARTAADTQALLELRKNYCLEKRCLDCAIGRLLLRPPTSPAEALAKAGPPTSPTELQPRPLTPAPASESPPLPPDPDEYCTSPDRYARSAPGSPAFSHRPGILPENRTQYGHPQSAADPAS